MILAEYLFERHFDLPVFFRQSYGDAHDAFFAQREAAHGDTLLGECRGEAVVSFPRKYQHEI